MHYAEFQTLMLRTFFIIAGIVLALMSFQALTPGVSHAGTGISCTEVANAFVGRCGEYSSPAHAACAPAGSCGGLSCISGLSQIETAGFEIERHNMIVPPVDTSQPAEWKHPPPVKPPSALG